MNTGKPKQVDGRDEHARHKRHHLQSGSVCPGHSVVKVRWTRGWMQEELHLKRLSVTY